MDNWNKFIDFIKENKAGALATINGDRPQVRAVVFVSLDERNVIYTTTDNNISSSLSSFSHACSCSSRKI